MGDEDGQETPFEESMSRRGQDSFLSEERYI